MCTHTIHTIFNIQYVCCTCKRQIASGKYCIQKLRTCFSIVMILKHTPRDCKKLQVRVCVCTRSINETNRATPLPLINVKRCNISPNRFGPTQRGSYRGGGTVGFNSFIILSHGIYWIRKNTVFYMF